MEDSFEEVCERDDGLDDSEQDIVESWNGRVRWNGRHWALMWGWDPRVDGTSI